MLLNKSAPSSERATLPSAIPASLRERLSRGSAAKLETEQPKTFCNMRAEDVHALLVWCLARNFGPKLEARWIVGGKNGWAIS